MGDGVGAIHIGVLFDQHERSGGRGRTRLRQRRRLSAIWSVTPVLGRQIATGAEGRALHAEPAVAEPVNNNGSATAGPGDGDADAAGEATGDMAGVP